MRGRRCGIAARWTPTARPATARASFGCYSNDADVEQLVALVEARDAFGRRKYGQPLFSDDGRDVSADFGQELADALQYSMAARMRGVSLAVWAPVLRALADLVSDDAQDLDRRVIAGVQTQRGLPFT